jgi:4-hydroxythreonine-4-phosphate dehydrogenase
VHIPLASVSAALSEEGLLHTLRTCRDSLRKYLGIPEPRLVVCGLNPHAGEGGVIGEEELRVIGPACVQARAEGMSVWGPVSAETAFLEVERGDLILAMYHDQGLVPLKALGFGRCVNWTLGLPILRTSVDHGTADALVGTGKARPDSMVAALRLAERLSQEASYSVSQESPKFQEGQASGPK